MFEQTPDWSWYVAVANLTKWAHWPAISAVVAGLAWWRTGSLADRANRIDRQKSQVFLLSCVTLLDEILDQIDDFAEAVAVDGIKDVCSDIISIWEHDQTIEQVMALRMSDFPNVETMGDFSIARATVQLIAMQLRNQLSDLPKKMERNEQELRAYRDSLEAAGHSKTLSAHDRAISLKSLPARLRAMWTARPAADDLQTASTDEKA